MRAKMPPPIIFHGTTDTMVPFAQATKFCAARKQPGNACEVKSYERRGHDFFNFGHRKLMSCGEDFKSTLQAIDDFLVSLGSLKSTTK
ncbi:MAG: prolyl oligopeptidase family serine peptidase [Acidobacteria bacterium]|jgi:acetyl esterase/lipase|nr:prolyl oligopeptidase family serine peptidase [Acidobacteriota bacterium]